MLYYEPKHKVRV